MFDFTRLEQTRDLSLPDWGPYSKDYFALSHVTDPAIGRLFECLFIPGIHSERVYFPDKRDSWNIVPLSANRDLSDYAMRFLMDPGCHADVRVQGQWPDCRLVDIDFANTTAGQVGFRLDFALGFQKEEPTTSLELREEEAFLSAHRYREINLSLPSTAVDQAREGIIASGLFIERAGLGPAFTGKQGARVDYLWRVDPQVRPKRIALRYALTGATPVDVRLGFGDWSGTISLPPTGKDFAPGCMKILATPFPGCAPGEHELSVEIESAPGDGNLRIDGFFLLPAEGDPETGGRLKTELFTPDLQRHVEEDFFAIRSELAPDRWYGVLIADEAPPFHVWKLAAGDMAAPYRRLGCTSRYWTRDRVIDNENEHLVGDLRPIFCPEDATVSVQAVIGFGRSPEELKQHLAETRKNPPPPEDGEGSGALPVRISRPEYRQCLQAVTAAAYTTVCYPQDLLVERVKHFSPGAFFPTLYLWDAGVQSLALASVDPQRALENINTYLPPLEDPKPLMLHGSVLPTQIFAWWEVYLETGDRGVLKAVYPKMRRYYRFMAGQEESLMDPFGTGLLCPWHYFYNSAGWDDYPAQAHVADRDLGRQISPVANTAYTARTAKLMALAARELDLESEANSYESDAERFMETLLRWSWDAESGYFAYVIDASREHLKAGDGSNFNCGLDGVSPLVGGLPPDAIRDTLIENCRNPSRLWTQIGLSTVDQSAAYYSDAGYWNGAVWIAHQWFFFKAFLDCGEVDLARRLAQNVCAAWKDTVAAHRGQTFEAMHIRTQRGIGTPHFNALSLPVVPLYEAVFEPGRLTAGFDTIRRNVNLSAEQRCLVADVANPIRPGRTGLLAVMPEAGPYRIGWMNTDEIIDTDENGCLTIQITTVTEFQRLTITPA